jgi:hypothetical protein
MRNPNRKVRVGDTFGYNYNTNINTGSGWLQMHHNYEHLEFFYAAKLSAVSYFRDGKMPKRTLPNKFVRNGRHIHYSSILHLKLE